MSEREELDRIYRRFESTLTERQQRLLLAHALKEEMLTPEQAAILREMDPYLEGMNTEQARRLGMVDAQAANAEAFAKGWREGLESTRGRAQVIKVSIIVILVCIVLGWLLR